MTRSIKRLVMVNDCSCAMSAETVRSLDALPAATGVPTPPAPPCKGEDCARDAFAASARVLLVTLCILGRTSALALADDASRRPVDSKNVPAAAEQFEKEVLPILQQHCFECHSHAANKAKGGLVLDSRGGWATGGDSGPAIVPGNLDESLLVQAVRYTDLQMPPKGKLPAEAIATLERWVRDGAFDPREGTALKQSGGGMSVEEGRKFWAFVPPAPQAVPVVLNEAWPCGPVDRFVLAKLEEQGLAPSPEADAYTLLRRLSFDLTGLPPSPEEIQAFVKDCQADSISDPDNRRRVALEAAVDRLLGSQAFGERWARHWLDLALYADNVSVDRLFPDTGSWRYRDYVIRAFNEDQRFDEFVREQIAGDLLPAHDDRDRAEKIVATAFLTHGPIQVINQFKDQLRWDVVDIQVSKIGQVFLGQTLQCARCHDHKFDPIPQHDYYALAGILQNVRVLNGFVGSSKVFSDVVRVRLPILPEEQPALAAEQAEFERGKAALEAALAENVAELNEAESRLAAFVSEAPASATTATSSDAGSASSTTASGTIDRRAELQKKVDDARTAQKKAAGRLQSHMHAKAPQPPQIVAATEPENPSNARVTIRGQAAQLGDEIPRGFVQVASISTPPQIPENASGRLQLADWLTDPQNPLVARVYVNRVWHHLFGAGLVRSVDYFGVRGDGPTHPELLDWLALRFINDGWSTKRLIREIVLSRTYRQSSVPTELAAKAATSDPANRFVWRANRRRLEAEAFRDAVLTISGQLDLARGGRSSPELSFSGGVISNYLLIKGDGAPPKSISHRRSIYQPVYRRPLAWAEGMRLMDAPLPAAVTGARPITTVPTQALFLLNSEFLIEQSRFTARRLISEAGNDADRVRRLYLAALNRPAAAAEIQSALAFIADEESQLASHDEAWAQFCHAVFVSNEFLFRM